jgi:hypothetical protein
MGKTSLNRNRALPSLIPLTMMLIGSYLVLLNSIGKEFWRVTCAGVAFAGLLMLWIIFYRHLKKKEVQKSKTGK